MIRLKRFWMCSLVGHSIANRSAHFPMDNHPTSFSGMCFFFQTIRERSEHVPEFHLMNWVRIGGTLSPNHYLKRITSHNAYDMRWNDNVEIFRGREMAGEKKLYSENIVETLWIISPRQQHIHLFSVRSLSTFQLFPPLFRYAQAFFQYYLCAFMARTSLFEQTSEYKCIVCTLDDRQFVRCRCLYETNFKFATIVLGSLPTVADGWGEQRSGRASEREKSYEEMIKICPRMWRTFNEYTSELWIRRTALFLYSIHAI